MSRNEKSGCTSYLEAKAKIYFPNGDVKCSLCACLETYARAQCRLTGEYLVLPNSSVGMWCPLEFDGEVKEVKRDES